MYYPGRAATKLVKPGDQTVPCPQTPLKGREGGTRSFRQPRAGMAEAVSCFACVLQATGPRWVLGAAGQAGAGRGAQGPESCQKPLTPRPSPSQRLCIPSPPKLTPFAPNFSL